MNLAVHGTDAVFLFIAAILFLAGAIAAFIAIEPRVIKVLWIAVTGGLLFLTLAQLFTG